MARLLPLPVRRAIRGLRSSRVAVLADAAEEIINPRVRNGTLPPWSLRGYVGAVESFEAVGREFDGYLRDLVGLKADESLLDYGCGVGRMALPLARWLRGSYLGLDIDARCIDWCRRRITPRHPNIRFQRLDIRNARYNPRGLMEPRSLRLPLESVDVVLAASVFTHLRQKDAERLLEEFGRVARRGLITAYLVEEEDGRLPVRDGPARYANSVVPEEVVGYERGWFEDRLKAAGFDAIVCMAGRWRGGPGPSEQDLVIVAQGRAAALAPSLAALTGASAGVVGASAGVVGGPVIQPRRGHDDREHADR